MDIFKSIYHLYTAFILKKLYLSEEFFLKILLNINSHEIRIKLLDLSKNIISRLICKEISLICQRLRYYRKIMLDSKNITVFGVVYIFIAFIDDYCEGLDISILQMNNYNTTLLNNSMMNQSIFHLNVYAN